MPIFAYANPPSPSPDAAEIQLALRKLKVLGSVLYIAAHPDDENTNLLAYLSKHQLLRTAYLSLTRGDGGQNLIGSEQGPELGAIRTQELLAARRLDGAMQFFTRARDFGYSKNPEETLRIWDKQAVLLDAVRVIRQFRPDVILTRFSPEPTDTHGHHTASAQLALEAFHAAADPSFHPEQLTPEIQPWQAKRIVWNRSAWSLKPDEDLSDFLKMDVNAYLPLLGLSCGELAADSRSMHKSQGFGVSRTLSPIVEYFRTLAEVPPASSKNAVLDGLDFTYDRFKAKAQLKRLIIAAERDFIPATPHTILPTLLRLHKALDTLADIGWRQQKQAEVNDLIVACAGLFVETTANKASVVPGATLTVNATVINRTPTAITLRGLSFKGGEVVATTPQTFLQGPLGHVEIEKQVRISPELTPTTPYWLLEPPTAGLFRTPDPRLTGIPEAPAPLQATFDFNVAGHPLTIRRPVDFKWTDPVVGERHRPLEIVPLVSVHPMSPVLMLPNGEMRTLTVKLTGQTASLSGILRLEMPLGWTVSPLSQPISLATEGIPVEYSFQVSPPAGNPQKTRDGILRVVAEIAGRPYSKRIAHIEYPHIPIVTVLSNATVRLVAFAFMQGGNKIGYIPGPGDDVPAALRQVGYDVTMIDDKALANLPETNRLLSLYDAVVVGVRAFNTNEGLRKVQTKLMAYVHAGGRLVVQYHTNNRLAPLNTPIGPYPFTIGRERVTDENATVSWTAPHAPFLTSPNHLTPDDFSNWVQERGLYFAAQWDTHYQTVLTMHDPGEAPVAGSILWTHYGKGVFIYTGLAFFRQLPAGVPGAYRLFANLLAAGR